jgi:hypothetical protein
MVRTEILSKIKQEGRQRVESLVATLWYNNTRLELHSAVRSVCAIQYCSRHKFLWSSWGHVQFTTENIIFTLTPLTLFLSLSLSPSQV